MQTSFELPILKRIDHKDFDAINAAVQDGFNFIGTLHCYELNIPKIHSDIQLRLAQGEHLNGAVQVGLAELRHSRLYTDPKIPFETAQKVYEERIRRAFQTATVFVAVHETDGVVGFCSLLEDEIELIAVTSFYQGQGVGRRLVESCVDECRRRGFQQLKIKTQGSNRRARNFYEKLGFSRTHIQKDFHRHKSKALDASAEEKPNAAILHPGDPGGC